MRVLLVGALCLGLVLAAYAGDQQADLNKEDVSTEATAQEDAQQAVAKPPNARCAGASCKDSGTVTCDPEKGGDCTDWDYAFCSSEPCDSYKSCKTCGVDPMC